MSSGCQSQAHCVIAPYRWIGTIYANYAKGPSVGSIQAPFPTSFLTLPNALVFSNTLKYGGYAHPVLP